MNHLINFIIKLLQKRNKVVKCKGYAVVYYLRQVEKRHNPTTS
jgi:hypothetical protein